MKKLMHKLLVLIMAPLVLVSCDDHPMTIMNADPSSTMALSTDEVTLDILNSGQDVLTVSWSAPDFGFDAAPNYDVILSYGAESTTVSAGTDLSKTFETVELNKILLNLGLLEEEAADVNIQVKTFVGDYTSYESNTAVVTATPYSTAFDPIYMIGDALLGWDTSKAVEVRGTGPGTYEVIAKFNNGGAFRFFDAADWGAASYNWTYFETGSIDANFENAADGDTNIRFIGATGYFSIKVNLITKTITMDEVDEPVHFIVGAGVPTAGWGWDTPVVMTWVKDGVYTATTDFANDGFRFFTSQGDWGSGRNFPYYVAEDFDIDANFEDAQDGDNNFKFIGTPGTYTVTIDYFNQTIILTN